jgi:hypothetical protein
VISLRALDNEFTGVFLGSWKELGDALLRKKKLSRETYSSLLLLHYFGLLIGNTDMHSGNLSFYCDDKAPPYRPTSLAPIYDMLPMTAAPSHEHVPPLTPHFPTLDPQDRSTYQRAARLALEFWKKVAANEWLGDDWKAFAKEWMRFIEGTVD